MSAIIVIVLSFTDIVAVLLNALVLITFAKFHNQLNLKDYLIIGMAVSDLLQCLLGYPLEIYSSRHGHWKFDLHSCKAAGFFITFLGLVSIWYLTLLAIDLYVTLCFPFRAITFHSNGKWVKLYTGFPWVFALVWAVSPLLGWSSYAKEDDKLRCSIDWNGQSLADKTYIAFLFFFCFLVPISGMCYSFFAVKRELRNMYKRALAMDGMPAQSIMDNIKAEKKHTRMAIIMAASFVMMWMPYSLISFWSAYFKYVAKPPIVLGTVAAIFAKTSTLANPIIYSFMHTKFRNNAFFPYVGRLFRPNRVDNTAATSSKRFSFKSGPTMESNGDV